MAKKKFKIAADDSFVREIKITRKDGKVVTFGFQPYVIGMYVSVTCGIEHDQFGIEYPKLGKMVKNVLDTAKKEGDAVESRTCTYDQFLSEKDIELINE